MVGAGAGMITKTYYCDKSSKIKNQDALGIITKSFIRVLFLLNYSGGGVTPSSSKSSGFSVFSVALEVEDKKIDANDYSKEGLYEVINSFACYQVNSDYLISKRYCKNG